MNEQLKIVDETLYVDFWLEIEADKENVWAFLTTDERLSLWFTEIQIGELSETGYLKFILPNETLTMPIIAFESGKKLAFQWASGEVCFEINEEQGTLLKFSEKLPPEFPAWHRDIAGWSLVLPQLKSAIEGNPLPFPKEQHPLAEEKYRQKIAQLRLT